MLVSSSGDSSLAQLNLRPFAMADAWLFNASLRFGSLAKDIEGRDLVEGGEGCGVDDLNGEGEAGLDVSRPLRLGKLLPGVLDRGGTGTGVSDRSPDIFRLLSQGIGFFLPLRFSIRDCAESGVDWLIFDDDKDVRG